MTKGTVKVPAMFEKMMPNWNSEDPDKRDDARYAAAMLYTMTCAALLGAGVTAGVKGLQYVARGRDIGDSNNPAKGIRSKLNTSFDPLAEQDAQAQLEAARQEKTAKQDNWKPGDSWDVEDPGVFSKRTFWSMALPVGAMVLAGALTDYAVDKTTGALEANRINKKYNRRVKLRNDLFTARAKAARGNLSQQELDALNKRVADEGLGLEKDAKEEWKGLVTGTRDKIQAVLTAIGVLATAIGGASFMGSYWHTKKSDPTNLKYEAIKKGLNEYAKQKAGMTPIDVTMPSDAYFDAIEGRKPGDAQKKLTARAEPDMSNINLNTPISITL